MDDSHQDDLALVLPLILQALETLSFVARHFHPPHAAELLAAVAGRDQALRTARPRLDGWPASMDRLRALLSRAADSTLAAFDALRQASSGADGAMAAFRAFRHAPLAQEALYPLARDIAPVSRFFLSPDRRGDLELQARFAAAETRPETGVLHVDNTYDSRGGYSLYVPETISPEAAIPLVVALHGGSGHGRSFLYTWLRDARARGAILAAPTYC